MTKLDAAVRASLALGLAIVVSAVADASEAPIYKCIQADGGVLYTDSLCKGGELLDIQSSAPDPAAIKRLERAQAALDRSAIRRTADLEIEAVRREEMERLLREEEAARRAAVAAFLILAACRAQPSEPQFPAVHRDVAPTVSDTFSTEDARDRGGTHHRRRLRRGDPADDLDEGGTMTAEARTLDLHLHLLGGRAMTWPPG